MNHSGMKIYDYVNNQTDADITASMEFNDVIDSTKVKYKTTRYMSRTVSGSTKQLVFCEGDTVYDPVSNACYPEGILTK